MRISGGSNGLARGIAQCALDALDCQIAVVDLSGDIVLANGAWNCLAPTGQVPAVPCGIGTNYFQALRSSGLASSGEVVEGIQGVLTHRTTQYLHDYLSKDSCRERCYRLTITPCETGDAPHAVIAHRATAAIAECQQSFRSSARLAAVIDAAPDPVISATPEGDLQYCNAAWRQLVGAEAGTSLESVLQRRIHPSDGRRRSECWEEAVRSGRPYEVEYRLESVRGGAFRWFVERGSRVPETDGQSCAWVATLTCIDANKRSEEALRTQLITRDRFFETLLHELRTPLAPICSSLQVLGSSALEDRTARHLRGIIERQVHQLSRLVDDLLEVCQQRRDTFDLHLRKVALQEVLGVAIESARHLIEQHAQRLTLAYAQDAIELIADPERLGQVFANLLVNAAKYTPDGGHIWVAAALHGRDLCVRIRDDGIGIRAEELTSIFELFARSASLAPGKPSGRGIGLAVARELIQLHGGTVSALSEGPGRGSEFIVRLPVSQGHDSEAQSAGAEDGSHEASLYSLAALRDGPASGRDSARLR